MAQECVSLYPNSTVTIYDLPKVVQVAKEQFVSPEERQIAFHEGRWGSGVELSQLLLWSPTALLRGFTLEAQLSSCPLWGQCLRLQPLPGVHQQLSETQRSYSAT